MKNANITILLLGLFGCSISVIEPNNEIFGFSYFPLNTGSYKIYNTNVIHYNLDNTIDSISYQIKEIVSDTIINQSGEIVYSLRRFVRGAESVEWAVDSVWVSKLANNKAIVIEHNQPIIKLVFPIKEGISWDSNALNTRDNEEYKVEGLGIPYELNNIIYDNTLSVIHSDLLDPIQISNDDYRREVYAEDVGLIFKQSIVKKYCSKCTTPSIEKGIFFEQKLIEFGQE